MDLERYRAIVPDWGAFTEAAARAEPTVFRIVASRAPEEEIVARLGAQGFVTRPLAGQPGLFTAEVEPFPVSMTFEHWNGLIYVQQASTGLAAPALGPLPGERVLDLCAAPGGKTVHMAELMRDEGCLVASEINESRIRGLLGNVYRLGHTNIVAVAVDGRDFPPGASFDRVLVDAPCSGEGTLRRRGGRVPMQSSGFLRYVTSAQRALLARAVELTRPGGAILYVTCTFAPEENEAVVDHALRTLPVDLEPLELAVPHARGITSFDGARYDPRVEGAARIYPHHLDSGGLFLALLRRRAGDGGSPRGADGWDPVPLSFPEVGEAAVDPSGDEDLVARAKEDLGGRFGVAPARLDELSWTVRGGRVWMHTVDAWPVESWPAGAWRPISIGLRAVEFDTQGRPRPTNDALRILSGDVTSRRISLDDRALTDLLARRPVPVDLDTRGPVAVAWRDDVIGRGAVTAEGLKSEIPKARAADLRRGIERATTREA